jgi:hypothetical protein
MNMRTGTFSDNGLMMWIHYSIFLLLPFGAGLMRGVYVTVRVTISLTVRVLDRADFGDLISNEYLALLFMSQSKGERALRALKGERRVWVEVALNGESAPVNAGD